MIRDTITPDEILRRTRAVGDYYGFVPFSTLATKRRGQPKNASDTALVALDQAGETMAGFLRQCRDSGVVPSSREPLFVWHSNIAPGRPAPRVAHIQFHAIGTDRALADAVVIHAMRALVNDLTKEEAVVRVNTLGDRETRARYARELGNFFKKRANILPEECLTSAKRDVFEAAEFAVSRSLTEGLPVSTDFLSDQSRKRFEELLEYLELTETPFELAPDLISRSAAWSETCFTIMNEGVSLVWGSRYGDLARSFFKGATPAAGALLKIETGGMGNKTEPIKNRARLRFAFVHIGEEAKRESIKLAERFRRARLPLWQVIGLESLTEQMLHVERLNPPYLLIMGRKEALENSVVLRDRATQVETAILISELPDRLREFA